MTHLRALLARFAAQASCRHCTRWQLRRAARYCIAMPRMFVVTMQRSLATRYHATRRGRTAHNRCCLGSLADPQRGHCSIYMWRLSADVISIPTRENTIICYLHVARKCRQYFLSLRGRALHFVIYMWRLSADTIFDPCEGQHYYYLFIYMWYSCADSTDPCEGELYYFLITLYSRRLLLCANLARLCTLYILLLVISLFINIFSLNFLSTLSIYPSQIYLHWDVRPSYQFDLQYMRSHTPCNYDSRLGRIYPIIRVTRHSSHSIVLRPEGAHLGRSLSLRPPHYATREDVKRPQAIIDSHHCHVSGPIRI